MLAVQFAEVITRQFHFPRTKCYPPTCRWYSTPDRVTDQFLRSIVEFMCVCVCFFSPHSLFCTCFDNESKSYSFGTMQQDVSKTGSAHRTIAERMSRQSGARQNMGQSTERLWRLHLDYNVIKVWLAAPGS